MKMEAKQQRIDEDTFLKMRKEVLSLWPTGGEVDLGEAVAYQKHLPESKNWFKVVQRVREEGRTVLRPNAGTPLLVDEIKLCKAIYESGTPLIPITADTYTRQLQFEKARTGLEESERTGRPMLNGYPIVNYGVKNTRKIIESCEGAFVVRLSRLANPIGGEIGFASGCTAINCSPYIQFANYEKHSTLEECILSSFYPRRLMGYYADREVILTEDLHGLIAGTIFPPAVNLATVIADALIGAEQGVKSVMPIVHLTGYIPQDFASMRLTARVMREYLDKFGYTDVAIPGTIAASYIVYPMPPDVGMAFGYVNYTAMVAALAGVEAVSTRTIDEGAGIATADSHGLSYRSANWILEVVRRQRIQIEIEEMDVEEQIGTIEVKAILDKVLEMGDGDIILGSIKAIDAGVIDSPFHSNLHIRDRVLGAKDSNGGLRYVEFGNLPLPEEVKKFHRERLAVREREEGRKMDYRVTIEDLLSFSKGKLLGTARPKERRKAIRMGNETLEVLPC